MDLGTLTASLFVDTSGMGAAVGAVQMFEKQANQSIRNVQNTMKTIGNDMQNFGRNASMYLTAPLALAGGAAFKMSKDFETSMQDIVGLVGMSQDQVDAWSKQILEVAPKLGQAPKELADALYFVTSSGFKSAEAMEIVMQSAKAASAGLGDTKKIADLVTSAMNAYKDSNLQAITVVDNLTAAVREGKGEAAQFASEMGEVIPVAARMGVAFDQIASGMSAMTLTGSTVEETATYMRQILVSLLDATPKAEEALRQMGTSSAYLRKEIRDKGLLSALSTLNDLTKQYGEDMMGKVFGNIRALTGVLSLMGDRLEENRTLFQVVLKSAGDMNKAFEVAADTINFKYNAALSQLQSSTIQLGLSFKDMVIPIIEGFSAKLKSLTTWYANLNPQTKELIIKTVAFAAVIGPLTLGLGVLISTFVKLGAVLKGLALFMSANPLFLMAAAVGSVIYVVNKVNSAFKATLSTGFNDYIEAATASLENMVKSANNVQSAMGDITQRFTTIKKMSPAQLTSFMDDLKTQITQEEKLIKELVKSYEALEPAYKLRAEAAKLDMVAAGASMKLEYGDPTKSKKYWEQELHYATTRASALRDYANANEKAYESVDKAKSALQVLNDYLKEAEAQSAVVKDQENVATYIGQIADIGVKMKDAEMYTRKMAQAQMQIGAEYDLNKELLKIYNKGLEEYLSLVDISNPKVQQLIKTIKELNASMSNTNMYKAIQDQAKALSSKNQLGKPMKANDLLKSTEERSKAYAELQKELAWVAYENSIVSDSFDYSEGQRQYDLITAKLQIYRQEMQRLFDLQQANKELGLNNSVVNSQLASTTEQIIELQNQLNNLEAGQFVLQNLGTAFSNFGNVVQGVYDAAAMMNAELGSGMKRFIEWGNIVISVTNGILGLIEFFNALGVALGLTTAKTTAQTVATTTQAIATSTQSGANVALATSAAASTIPLAAQTTAMIALAAASTSAAIAGAAAAASWVLFPANLIAIPASIGAMTSALAAGTALAQTAVVGGAKAAAMMKEGGVVPSGYPNDTYPAMLTSGEMVTPPGKLPMNIGTPNNVMQGEVVFKISGDELQGILRKMGRKNQLV